MPQILDDCVSALKGKGVPEDSAFPICRARLKLSEHLKPEDIDDMAEEFKKKKFKEMEMGDIQGVEIFAEGTWNGDKFTHKNLVQIVDTFNKTKDKIKPFLKLGHGKEQKALKKDELPAAGFIESLRVEGKKLLADFVNVPKKIFELIRHRAFDRVSAEMFINMTIDGEIHEWVLKAVALLGGETPAVHDLNSMVDLFFIEAIAFGENAQTKSYEADVSTKEVNTMDNNEMAVKLAKAEAETKQYQQEAAASDADAKKADEAKAKAEKEAAGSKKVAEDAKADADKANAATAKASEEKKNSEIDAEVKSYVDDEKITPHAGEVAKVILKNFTAKEKTFKIEDKEYKSLGELFKEFVAGSDIKFSFDPKAGNGESNKGDDALTSKAKKYQKEHEGVTFKQALIEVSE